MTLNDEENTHPLSSNSNRDLASKLMEPTSFDRSSSNSKNMLRDSYSYCITKANEIFGYDGWSSSILHSQIISKEFNNNEWCVCIEMNQRISLKSGPHREFACSLFSCDEKLEVAIYRAYHNVLYHTAICAFQQFGSVFMINPKKSNTAKNQQQENQNDIKNNTEKLGNQDDANISNTIENTISETIRSEIIDLFDDDNLNESQSDHDSNESDKASFFKRRKSEKLGNEENNKKRRKS